MQVLNLQPVPSGTGGVVARFDVQVSDHIRLNRMKLVKSPQGFRVWPAREAGVAIAYLAPALSRAITAAAVASLTQKGQMPDVEQTPA